MSTRSRNVNQKRLVGLLLVLTLAVALYAVYLAREQARPFADRYLLYAQVSRADAIRPGTPVTLAGIGVGEVRSLEITADNRIRVALEIEEGFRAKIRRDSRATLIKPLFSNPYIDIAIGSTEREPLPDRGEIDLTSTSGLADLLTTLPARLERLDEILANHIELSRRLADPDGDLSAGLAHFNAGLARFSELSRSLEGAESELRRSLGNLERITGNSAEVLTRVIETQDQLNRILDSAAGTLERLEASTEHFPANAAELGEILAEARRLSRALGAVAPEVAGLVEQTRTVLYEADRTLRASQRSFLIAPNLAPPPAADTAATPLDPTRALPARGAGP